MGRMSALLAAAVVLTAASVDTHAAGLRTSTAELCEMLVPCQPPAQFARGPYLGTPVIRHVGMRHIETICGFSGYEAFLGRRTIHTAGSGGDVLGCTEITGGSCIVHLPSELRARLPALYRLVLAHEMGHCRGWVH